MEVKSLGDQAQPKGPTSQPSPDGGGAAPADGDSATKAARPDWLPESHWNAEAGSINLDTFGEHYGELSTLKAEQDRLAGLTADDYKLDDALQGLEVPEGVQLSVADDNPDLVAARAFALEHKVDPKVLAGFYRIYAQSKVNEAALINAAVGKEQEKLGKDYATRVGAVRTAFAAHVGEKGAAALMSGLFTAEQVKAAEQLVRKLANGRSADVPANGHDHEPPPPPSTAEERLYPTMRRN